MKLEDIRPGAAVNGILPGEPVTVVQVEPHGSEALTLTYRTPSGKVDSTLLFRQDESQLDPVEQGRPWRFDGDGALFRLVSEAQRIRLAHLFDPMLAVHTSRVDPLPHQITAVYESMLPRQPLRFLLADDPGAGKTIMAGLLIRELIARGDLERCLIVCPGSLVEQWQDELHERFQLPFEILTRDKAEASRTGNWFLETDLVIARLDMLARSEDDLLQKLGAKDCAWDLVVCDEAHKMSASFSGGEINYTKRHKLGRLLSGTTRHFLLMTATPHNGKDEDFQLFMGLLDADRFAGRFRDGAHKVDVSDLMRRMVKEKLLKMDGTPLFPERIAHTLPYKLSPQEAALYEAVTRYVREEFNRAEVQASGKRRTVGFALTILQRRLASSPAAIRRSLQRRCEKLEERLQEIESGAHAPSLFSGAPASEETWYEAIEDAPDDEVKQLEDEILGQGTAALTVEELQAEIATLKELEKSAARVVRSGEDMKWQALSGLLQEIRIGRAPQRSDGNTEQDVEKSGAASPGEKIIVFTEHLDTLHYLRGRIATLFGREGAITVIHGSKKREERLEAQEAFRHDPNVQVLLATDAAGEGINLQRAHLMVNYDLPWNPNRLEQRFGRIHRIGQSEVCHLWNLVAADTREGDVYRTLLQKLDNARETLGGQVFDVLGRLHFDGKSLRDLLIEAIRYGERPDVRKRLTTVIGHVLDPDKIKDLLEDHALAHAVMDDSEVRRISTEMDRAEVRRLQPHFIKAFFRDAFEQFGGAMKEREPKRYQIARVPQAVHRRDPRTGAGKPVARAYERIAFEKSLVAPPGQPLAAFVCPGHPLLDAVIGLTLERHRGLLRQGATLVDENDEGTRPRVLFYLEHAIRNQSLTRSGTHRTISKRMLHVEMDADGKTRRMGYAPYLDYRPLAEDEPGWQDILARPECAWIKGNLEEQAKTYAIGEIVPEHLGEIREAGLELIEKTRAAVQDRLTKEIAHWDRRAEELKAQEQAGKQGARLNSGEARRRADDMRARLDRRLQELELEALISPLPPVVLGGVLVVPKGLIDLMKGRAPETGDAKSDKNKMDIAAKGRKIVMDIERKMGYEPTDREFEKLGYDIESRISDSGKLRFIEVKAREAVAETITVTRNEILYSLNKPEDYILAIVLYEDDIWAGSHTVHYVRRPFEREPDTGACSVNYTVAELLARGEEVL